MYSVKPGEDAVRVNVKMYKRECGIKDDKTYRQAYIGLAAAGWIAICTKVKNVFFLNPAMGFKGSRIRKYPDRVEYI